MGAWGCPTHISHGEGGAVGRSVGPWMYMTWSLAGEGACDARSVAALSGGAGVLPGL